MKMWEGVLLWGVFWGFVIVGIIWLRVYLARRTAKTVRPQKGEIWTQDGQPMLIRAVAKHGVMLISKTATGQPHSWWDSWDEWDIRVHTRLVFKTSQIIVIPDS